MFYKAGMLLFLHFATLLELTSGDSALARLEELLTTSETTTESTLSPEQQNYPDYPKDTTQGEQAAAIPTINKEKQTTAESTSSPGQQNYPEYYHEDTTQGEQRATIPTIDKERQRTTKEWESLLSRST